MIAVVGGPADGVNKPDFYAGPCGVCRQMIYEFGTDIKIIVANSIEDYYVKTISELLPLGFGPENLKK